MNLPEITKEEFLESIRNGVKDAILTMTESGDGLTGVIIREPFLEAIRNGTYDALYIGSGDCYRAIYNGVRDGTSSS